MKEFLSAKEGLSMSTAQTITNLMNQRTMDIEGSLRGINNYKKTMKVNGEDYTFVKGRPLPNTTIDIIVERGQIHAAQAFLMETIKWKKDQLEKLKNEKFVNEDEAPKHPEYEHPKLKPEITEKEAWETLSASEYAEYLEQEAIAATIGKFIHGGGTLDTLRKELPGVPSLEFYDMGRDGKSPIKVEVHPEHTSEKLLEMHTSLAAKHKAAESRVNYFKAKVKNHVTITNATIANENGVEQARVNRINGSLMDDFNKLLSTYRDNEKVKRQEFERLRNEKIATLAATRILVPERFNPVVTKYNDQVSVK